MRKQKVSRQIEDFDRQMRDAEARFYLEGRGEAERWWSDDPRSIDVGEYGVFWDPFNPNTNSRKIADFGRILHDRYLGSYFQDIFRRGLLFKAEKTRRGLKSLAQQHPTLKKHFSSLRVGWYSTRLLGKWFEGWSEGVREKWFGDLFPFFLCN